MLAGWMGKSPLQREKAPDDPTGMTSALTWTGPPPQVGTGPIMLLDKWFFFGWIAFDGDPKFFFLLHFLAFLPIHSCLGLWHFVRRCQTTLTIGRTPAKCGLVDYPCLTANGLATMGRDPPSMLRNGTIFYCDKIIFTCTCSEAVQNGSRGYAANLKLLCDQGLQL